MLGIFIDGPLEGVMQEMPPAPVWTHRLPRRETLCYCDDPDGFPDVIEDAPEETVTYHVIMHGVRNRVAMLSIKEDEDAVLDALKTWTTVEFGAAVWRRNCRSRRAFS